MSKMPPCAISVFKNFLGGMPTDPLAVAYYIC